MRATSYTPSVARSPSTGMDDGVICIDVVEPEVVYMVAVIIVVEIVVGFYGVLECYVHVQQINACVTNTHALTPRQQRPSKPSELPCQAGEGGYIY